QISGRRYALPWPNLTRNDGSPKPVVQLPVHRSPRATIQRDGWKERGWNASHLLCRKWHIVTHESGHCERPLSALALQHECALQYSNLALDIQPGDGSTYRTTLAAERGSTKRDSSSRICGA